MSCFKKMVISYHGQTLYYRCGYIKSYVLRENHLNLWTEFKTLDFLHCVTLRTISIEQNIFLLNT